MLALEARLLFPIVYNSLSISILPDLPMARKERNSGFQVKGKGRKLKQLRGGGTKMS